MVDYCYDDRERSEAYLRYLGTLYTARLSPLKSKPVSVE